MATRALHRRRSVLRAATCTVENLERRRLLSDVSGIVFYDANKNGVQDAGENGIGSVRVYIDQNNNNQFDDGEIFDDTDPAGSPTEGQWSFEGLAAGTYTIRVRPADTDGITFPASGQDNEYTLNVDGVTDYPNIDFGIGNSTISGRVFLDGNGNGTYDAGEGLQNVMVFLDANNNGIYDSGEVHVFTQPKFLIDGVTPNPDEGRYTFVDLDAGATYKVRVNPAHYQVRVSANPADITPTTLQDVTEADVAALVFQLDNVSAIGGQVFNDANGNGIRDGGEALVAGAVVYADVNGNGVLDIGEPQATSQGSVNPQGQNYVLRGVEPGTYTIRVTNLPAGFTASVPVSRSVTTAPGDETSDTHFGLTGGGTTPPPEAENDFNGDGISDIVIQSGSTVQVWFLGSPTPSGNLKNIARTGTANLDSPGAGWTVGGYGDFDGDGNPDVFYHNDATGENRIYTFNGTTKIGEVNLPTLGNTAWRVVTAGDFDGDGDLDVMWRHSVTGQNTLWLMNNLVPSFKALPTAASQNWVVAGTGDFDGDGDRDILWYNHATNRSSTWLIDVTMTPIAPTFRGGPTLGTNVTNYRRLAVEDFDKDGIADILWANPSNPSQNAIWYLNHQTQANRIKGFGFLTGL